MKDTRQTYRIKNSRVSVRAHPFSFLPKKNMTQFSIIYGTKQITSQKLPFKEHNTSDRQGLLTKILLSAWIQYLEGNRTSAVFPSGGFQCCLESNIVTSKSTNYHKKKSALLLQGLCCQCKKTIFGRTILYKLL